MRMPPTMLATIAILLSACGLGEAEVNESPIVAPTTTTTTTVLIQAPADDVPDELAQADPAEPATTVAGDSQTTTTTVAPTTTTTSTSTTTSTTTTTSTSTTTTTTVAVSPSASFCQKLSELAQLNPHQNGIATDANAYANYIRWEVDQLEQVIAPVAIADDFEAYIEAERRTLTWVAANGAALNDLRELGSDLNETLGIADLSADVGRYFSYLRSECPQF